MENENNREPENQHQAPLERKELPRKRMDDVAVLEERIANLTEELAQRESELVAAREESLRAIAEADNYKKRLEREREERRKRDEAELLVSFLTVLDTLDKALETPITDLAGAGMFREGIELTRQQFHDILSRRGLERIVTLNLPFDPLTSQALTVEETSEVADGTVVREFLPGYMFKGTLARPARVAVARNASERKENSGDEQESG